MAKKTNPVQIQGILGQLTGTYNGIQFCKNGIIRLERGKIKKKIKDV